MLKDIILSMFTLLISIHLAVEQCEDLKLQCTNENKCRPLRRLCDNYEECGPGRICEINGANLDMTCFLPEDSVCKFHRNRTGIKVCEDGIENCLCATDDFVDKKCFKCLSFEHLVIPSNKLCDGNVDCPDLSDECMCKRKPYVCSQVKWNAQMQPEIDCEMNTDVYVDRNSSICNRRKECFDCIYNKNCSFPSRRKSNDAGKTAKQLQLDYCRQRTMATKTCDMHEDYYKHNDSCAHYDCNGDVKYFWSDKGCDGRRVCKEISSKCESYCKHNDFSNERSMIKNKGILVVAGAIGVSAFFGNVIVIFTVLFRDLFSSKSNSIVESKLPKLYAVMILNLSISNLLVAIYLVAILGKSLEFEGEYCLVDREWRSSAGCSALGALLVVGSEESILIMVLITLMRMKSVLRPFSSISLKRIYAVVLMSWILSFAIALIPLIPSLEDYFVGFIWYKDNQIFSFINRNEVQNLTNWLTFYFKKNNTSANKGTWQELIMLIEKIDSKQSAPQKYGFYSRRSVCLPTLFPSHESDGVWTFSVGLITLSILGFVLIAVGYAIMLKKATRKKPGIARRDNDNRKRKNTRMQHKIMRIIASDLFCWMPIAIVAFCHVGGVSIPIDWYLSNGLIINNFKSALNPFLYSDLPDLIWERACRLKLDIYNRCCLPVRNAFRGPNERRNDIEAEDAICRGDQQVIELQVNERTNEGRENTPEGGTVRLVGSRLMQTTRNTA